MSCIAHDTFRPTGCSDGISIASALDTGAAVIALALPPVRNLVSELTSLKRMTTATVTNAVTSGGLLFERESAASSIRGFQQPRQIDPIIFSTLASSRSTPGLVPSSGPFMGPRPTPDDERAVPNELVPGAAALVPNAPPVMDISCDPIPPPRANAAGVKRPAQSATQRTRRLFMLRTPSKHPIDVMADGRSA